MEKGSKNEKLQYAQLRQPWFAPPAWLFGPVWTVLYVIIAITYGYSAYAAWHGMLPLWLVGVLVLNLIANFSYTPLQFGLRNIPLATVSIFATLATLVVIIVGTYPYLPLVSLANIPYLAWVSFATLLHITIAVMNGWKYPTQK